MDLPQKDGLKKPPKFELIPLRDVAPAAIAEALSDFEVTRWLSRAPFPYSEENARTYQAACGGNDSPVRAIAVGGQFAGIIGIKPDLGYWLARPFWGRGLATAAARQMLAKHFFTSDAAVISGHFVGNAASARVLTKLGFRYTHVEAITPLSTGVETRLERMALEREAWWAAQGLPLVTPRLVLRPLCKGDAADLARIGGNARVARMLASVKSPWPVADLDLWMRRSLWTGRIGYRLAVCLPDGVLIGMVGLGGNPVSASYFIAPEHEGKGFATEATQAMLADAFRRFDLPEVEADHFEDNPASGRILTKLGFQRFGQDIASSAARERPAPILLYRLRATDLPESPDTA